MTITSNGQFSLGHLSFFIDWCSLGSCADLINDGFAVPCDLSAVLLQLAAISDGFTSGLGKAGRGMPGRPSLLWMAVAETI